MDDRLNKVIRAWYENNETSVAATGEGVAGGAMAPRFGV
jgi:hypothetical protein